MNMPSVITDVLDGVPSGQAISAVHLTMRLITHLAGWPSSEVDYRKRMLAIDTTERDREIANELIARIERNEEVGISQLDKPIADNYVKLLATFVDGLTRSNADPVRGQALLEKLRLGSAV